METKNGFTKMDANEFSHWIQNVKVDRKKPIRFIQQHHTFIPSYKHFTGNNHFERQQVMKEAHLARGFADIAQHFSIFPDGVILTGRNLSLPPAGIKGRNTGAICIENVGFFDTGADNMKVEQKNAIIFVTAHLIRRFGLKVNSDTIVYHHWFDLNTGVRHNGSGTNKSCPGTTFFGGNKVLNCEKSFLPTIADMLGVAIERSGDDDTSPTFESIEDNQDVDDFLP